MKSVFSICKIFSFCFFIVYIFSSCKSTITVYGKEVPKKVIIKITGYETNTGKLKMEDKNGKSADTILVWAGQTIKWNIKEAGIYSIDSIVEKKRSKAEVFKDKPRKERLSSTWTATIKDEKTLRESGVKAEHEDYNYDYNIFWRLTKKGEPIKFDPRIQVK